MILPISVSRRVAIGLRRGSIAQLRVLMPLADALPGALPVDSDEFKREFRRMVGIYREGDILYVREAFRLGRGYDTAPLWKISPDARNFARIWYDADTDDAVHAITAGRLRSPDTMPRWASRITLAVRNSSVQHLRDASFSDVIREGHVGSGRFRESYGEAWEQNPWCLLLGVTVHWKNVDSFTRRDFQNDRS